MKNHIDIIKTAKKLINEQLDALNELQKRIDENFENVVKLISNGQGRLIIIGLGKSGIIGRKIAATLNSTGTLASFIHASDALHGDLGNINNEDIVLFISKSGNTEELKQLVPLIKNMKLKIIGMTGNINSYLALNSNFLLNVSVDKEACPHNLAPTTSTTIQLVMGDSLAVSLLKLNNFSKKDFARFHPGGTLGKQLNLTINDLYDSSNRPVVFSNDNLEKVIMEISSKRLGATAVFENEKIVGIITDGDLRRMLVNKVNIKKVLAKDLMTTSPKTIRKNDLVYEAFIIMKEHSITQLLIISDKKYFGIIHLHDILKHNLF